VELWIIRTRKPARPSAKFPGISRPGLGTRLARLWDRVKAPGKFSCFRIECVYVSAMGAFAAGHSGNHFVFHQQRRRTDPASALRGILYFDIPDLLACRRVQTDDVILPGAHKKHSEANRQPSSLSVSRAGILGRF